VKQTVGKYSPDERFNFKTKVGKLFAYFPGRVSRLERER